LGRKRGEILNVVSRMPGTLRVGNGCSKEGAGAPLLADRPETDKSAAKLRLAWTNLIA
jgi:hypothetical protein